MNNRKRMFNKAIHVFRIKYTKLTSIDINDKSFSKIKPKPPSIFIHKSEFRFLDKMRESMFRYNKIVSFNFPIHKNELIKK